MERVTLDEIRRRVSWGSIIGGVMTVLAVSVLLSLLGTSIGLYMFDPTSSEPMSGIGTTVGIWTVVSLLISLFCGGYVAGKLAGADGAIHGFLVWATSLIITVILGIMLAVGAVKATANVLGSIASVTGNVISGVASGVGSGIQGVTDQVGNVLEGIDFDSESDGTTVRQDVRQALRNSGIRELQPEYLQRELRGVRSDLQSAVRTLARNPNDADRVINRFLERLQERGEKFSENINREDLTQAIANNSSMSQAEVERAVDEYTELINNLREDGRERIDNLQQSIEQVRQDWEETKQNALEEADSIANSAATSALISFFGILIGAGVAGFAGTFGVRRNREGYPV